MFKPAQGAVGVLVQPIGSSDTFIFVDAALAAKMVSALGTGIGDHTYLTIRELSSVEVVKVVATSMTGLTVERGKDGTLSQVFNAGAVAEYALVSDAVLEMINDRLTSLGGVDSLNFFINEPHTVIREDADVTINIVPLSVSSPDGTIDVTGEGNAIGISIQRGAFGCCDD